MGHRFLLQGVYVSANLGAGLLSQVSTQLLLETPLMLECPQCGKLFDAVPTSGDYCLDCADAIRDEGGLTAIFKRAWLRWLERAGRLCLIIAQRKARPLEDSSPAKESRIRIVLSFAVHQFIGTWGIALMVPWLVAFGADFLRLFGKTFPMHDSHWILTETGYFPLQIAFGMFLGWLLGRDLRRGAMVWVWVIPFGILCYAVATVPTISPFPIPSTLQAGISHSRLWHYFATGCVAEHRCLDQIVFTMPFYASAAYSIGALLASRMPKDSQLVRAIRFWASLTVGLFFIVGATTLVIEAMRPQAQELLRQSLMGSGELRWFMLLYELVPVAAGGCLILFADWIRRKQQTDTAANLT